MKTEQEIREWRMELKALVNGIGPDTPEMRIGGMAAIDAATWVLDDDPIKDLQRIRALAAEKIGEEAAGEWLKTPNPALVEDRAPIDFIKAGLADYLFPAIAAL